jgi:hypothetical protein
LNSWGKYFIVLVFIIYNYGAVLIKTVAGSESLIYGLSFMIY